MTEQMIAARIMMDRHMEDASDDLKTAWRTIREQLNPPEKIKRRKI
jgi:hypothetical protein